MTGTGLGTLTALDGTWTCGNTPFNADAIFLAGKKGVLAFRYFVSSASCPFLTGGGVITGQLQYDLSGPSAEIAFQCDGNEAQGMHCESTSATGFEVWA